MSRVNGRIRSAFLSSLVAICCASAVGADAPKATVRSKSAISRNFENLPLSFEPNRGQANSRVKFLSRGAGTTLYLTSTDATLVISRSISPAIRAPMDPKSSKAIQDSIRNAKIERRVIRTRFIGANPATRIEGIERLTGASNYFVGSDKSKWRTNIPNYAKARYRSLYPGIDLVYYGTQGHLEFDVIAAPGADPNRFGIAVDGGDKTEINSAGDLVVHAGADQIVFHKPIAYQEIAHGRQPVAANFKLRSGNNVGFEIGSYNRHQPLVIDPGLVYSSFLGGILAWGRGIAVDALGSAYVTGFTDIFNDFPTTPGSYQTSLNSGSVDAFVSKFTPDGSGLVYSTYLGGSSTDEANGIAVDSAGDAYVTGWTESADFPQASTTVQSGNHGLINVFLTELNPQGSGLIYSTYLGGSSIDIGEAIAVDAAGIAYVGGRTFSANFPTTPSAFQSSSATQESFLTKLSVTGGSVGIAYSTFISEPDSPPAIVFLSVDAVAVDGSGNVYVSCQAGPNFPITTGPAYGGAGDALVVRIDTTLSGASSLIYARYLGGSSFEYTGGIAINPGCVSNCNAYVAGTTASIDFPLTTGAQVLGANIFVTELNPTGAIVYSTVLPAANQLDSSSGIAVDPLGDAFIAGSGGTAGFPTVNPVQAPGAINGESLVSTDGGPTFHFANWPGGAAGSATLHGISLDTSSTPATEYVATVTTGVWKSIDGGNSFSQTSLTAGGLALAFTNLTTPARLYAGGQGTMLVSIDGAASFTQLTAFPPAPEVLSIETGGAGDPLDIFVGTTQGLYRSTDGGASFTLANGIPATAVVYSGVADGLGNFFAGTDRGIFKSNDLGVNFSLTNWNQLPIFVMAADTVSSPPIVYAGGFGPLVSSTDGFNANIRAGSIPALDFIITALGVDQSTAPATPLPVIAGVQDDTGDFGIVTKSVDGGATFNEIFNSSAFPR